MTPEQLRRAILAILLAPDPDARWRGWRQHWPHIVRAPADAYGPSTARFRFDPDPADLALADTLAPALAALRRQRGEPDLRLVFAWALETPPWRLAQRLAVTPRTVRARTERALGVLVGLMPTLPGRGGPLDMDPPRFGVDMHPPSDHPRSCPAPRLPHGDAALAEPARAWVSGSWFTNGRRHRRSPTG